jgi:hypothetical protein
MWFRYSCLSIKELYHGFMDYGVYLPCLG